MGTGIYQMNTSNFQLQSHSYIVSDSSFINNKILYKINFLLLFRIFSY